MCRLKFHESNSSRLNFRAASSRRILCAQSSAIKNRKDRGTSIPTHVNDEHDICYVHDVTRQRREYDVTAGGGGCHLQASSLAFPFQSVAFFLIFLSEFSPDHSFFGCSLLRNFFLLAPLELQIFHECEIPLWEWHFWNSVVIIVNHHTRNRVNSCSYARQKKKRNQFIISRTAEKGADRGLYCFT